MKTGFCVCALVLASHSVVPSAELLPAADCQACSVHCCGHTAGKGQVPATLLNVSAAATARYKAGNAR